MNKILSGVIYLLAWVVAILCQSYLLGSNNPLGGFWQVPQHYYSTWVVDAFLVLLFYVNYYWIAPVMIRRSLYKQYIWVVLIAAAIALLIPISLYYIMDWRLPLQQDGQFPFSFWAVLGAITVITVGLCIRGIKEWARRTDQEVALQAEISSLKEQLSSSKKLVQELEGQLLEHAREAKIKSLEEAKEKTIDETHPLEP